LTDDSFLLCFNASAQDIPVTLPDAGYGSTWAVVVDTASGEVVALGDSPGMVAATPPTVPAAGPLTVPARSLLVLQRTE
jgi:glycogen operon protein